MLLYNTLTRKKEEFKPIHSGKVGMYVCGPTVYDHCHLGHGRGYVSMDILRRYLEYRGYEVRHIMNYTDVGHLANNTETGEDKIEKKAQKEKIDPIKIADRYIQSCQEDFEFLNIKPANYNPRPTKYINEIIKFVGRLIEKGYAYEINGSVYFSVEKFKAYGELSGRDTDELLEGARIEINPDKKNPLDFALWIKAPEEHILKWKSPWSIGYPGWHIECSVMSCDLLGNDTFDIHGGGNENIFPHNENEVAQSEAYLGKKMSNFWVLWNMVQVDGVKMSKSLGNFTTIKDALKEYDSSVLRLWIASSHYRSIIQYTGDSLAQAKKNLQKISDFVLNMEIMAAQNLDIEISAEIPLAEFEKKFEEAMDDDLNTPLALSILYELITAVNKITSAQRLPSKKAKEVLAFWKKMNTVFGLKLNGQAEIPAEILSLAEKRQEARQEKDFQKADDFRKNIEEKGYVVEDADGGFRVKKK
jgi:cysteinyl-tRNA synthetase